MEVADLQYAVFRIAAPAFALGLGVLLGLARTRTLRANPAASLFGVYAAATIGYLILSTLEVCSLRAADNLLWSRAIYLFVPYLPTLWFAFALRNAREGRPLEWPLLALLLAVPVVTMCIALSDRWMHLLWPTIRYRSQGGFIISTRTHGPWFYVFLAYCYALGLAGVAVAARAIGLRRSYYQLQSIGIFVGVMMPLGSNAVYALGLMPALEQDYTPIGYALAAVCFFFSMYRWDAFRIVPLARSKLVEHIADGILVFDSELRVADANPAALRLFGLGEKLLGRTIAAGAADRAELPPAVAEAASAGRRGNFDQGGPDGRTRHYSVEPIELPHTRRFAGRLVVIRDETELREAVSALAELARRDVLTGLPNRRGFMDEAATLIAAAERFGEPLAVAMFDLDRFKQVNDSHGHAAGDEVLRGFAATVNLHLRGTDLAGRIGGEEFALVLARTDLAGALGVCERIREEFGRRDFADDLGAPFRVTVSAGVTGFRAAGDDLPGLLAAADLALYRAKAAGRDRCLTTDPAQAAKPADAQSPAPLP